MVEPKITVWRHHVRGTSHVEDNSPYQDCSAVFRNLSNQNKKLAPIDLFIVCDGHGKEGELVSGQVTAALQTEMTKLTHKFPLTKTVVRTIYRDISEKLKHETYSYKSGSTAIVVILYYKNKAKTELGMQTINVGDSRAVYSRNYVPGTISLDHKPSWPAEKKRINEANFKKQYDKIAVYDPDIEDYRLLDVLSPSRGFGDINYTPYLTHVPDIFDHGNVQEYDFIILASDGIWDFIDTDQTCNFVNDYVFNGIKDIYTWWPNADKKEMAAIEKKLDDPAAGLIQLALANNSDDDITVIVVQIHH